MPSHKPSSLLKKAERAGVWRARLRVRPVRPRSGILAKLGPPKARRLDQPIAASLDDLVPPDHFYRHLEQALDLGFVRDLVRDRYAGIGRPSIDPVVLFKLQLVLFFDGPRSEHQLLRVVADSLSLRWYVGYDLSEPLPDHSSPASHPRTVRSVPEDTEKVADSMASLELDRPSLRLVTDYPASSR